MSKIVLTGYIEVPTEDLEAVLTALPIHKALTNQEPGCLIFEVTQDQPISQINSVFTKSLLINKLLTHTNNVLKALNGEKSLTGLNATIKSLVAAHRE